MDFIIYVYLFIFWTLFWSFSSVIIDRIRNQKSGIVNGRSECPKCKHQLSPIDLIPLFSFLSTKWKCRYCKTKISYIYPILEITSAILFVCIWYFLIDIPTLLSGNGVEIYKLIFFLLFWFLSVVYVFYDILYLEIPDSILAILVGITFISVWAQSIFPWFEIIKTLPSYNPNFSSTTLYSLLLLWWAIIGSYYFIMLKWLKEIYDLAILGIIVCIIIFIKYYLWINLEETGIGSALLGSVFVFLFLFLQIFISGWAWMWWGDLRIAILLWMIGWVSYSFWAVMISYFLWSIIWTVLILYTKIKNYYKNRRWILNKIRKILGFKEKKIPIDTKMPFGPFLAIWMLSILFYTDIINDLIKKYL